MYTVLQVHSSAKSDIGLVRKNNEDRFACHDGLRLYIVADGMGGHAAGEVAAELAVTSVTNFVRAGRYLLDACGDDEGQLLQGFVKAAAEHAAEQVYWSSFEDRLLGGMGTTLTVLVIADQTAVVAHVGDSRAYRFRGDRFEQLTNDHTMRAMMIAEGMDPDRISRRFDHVLVRSIGHGLRPEIDLRIESLCDGDRFLLCSDGLSNQFTDDEMSALIDDERDLETIVENLIAVGKLAGGKDNLTAVLVEARSVLANEKPDSIGDRPLMNLRGDSGRCRPVESTEESTLSLPIQCSGSCRDAEST